MWKRVTCESLKKSKKSLKINIIVHKSKGLYSTQFIMCDMERHKVYKNLVVLDTERARELGKLGGHVVTEKRIESQKLRWIKKGLHQASVTNEQAQWLLDRIENKPAMAIDILCEMERIKESEEYQSFNAGQRMFFVKVYNEIMKSVHGEKLKVDVNSSSISINLNLTLDSYPKLISKEGAIDDGSTISEDN